MRYLERGVVLVAGCLIACGAAWSAEESAATSQAAPIEAQRQTGERLMLLQTHVTSQRWEDAEQLSRALLATASDPKLQAHLNRQLVSIAKQRGTLDALLAEAAAVVAKDPANRNAHWQLIEGPMMNGKPQESLAAAEQAVNQFPDDQEFKVRLLSAYHYAGQPDKAIDGLKEAHAKDPDDASITFQLSQAYSAAGRPDDALALLDSAKQSDPVNAVAYEQQRAEVYARAQQLDKAIAIYESLPGQVSEPVRREHFAKRIEQLKQQQQAMSMPPAAPGAQPGVQQPAVPPSVEKPAAQ